ncbi:MAG: signal peptide peptidase SppA [Hyphomicrobiales bacterium]|nr:signal peptide peptidase SppA [Hyphomicrobiales bacterium]MCY4048532.1 signal peptide peptidase SppA [Hyphomicrobiales bacterium]MCY4053642.1 signal peptide peptidase SppA [Hyphomicrobiales bacterium]
MSQSSIPTDALVERRQLKRRLILWRVVGITSVCLFFLALLFPSIPPTRITGEDHIARFAIEGIIADTTLQAERLDEIAQADEVRALLLHVNSPGGTITGSETLFNAVRRVAVKKPVAVIMNDIAASGGYIVAIAGDHIVARHNTITGSIGVIFQWFEAGGLVESIGIQPYIVTSGPLKGQPNLFEAPSEETLEVTRESVEDAFQWFVSLVAERRGFEYAQVLRLADGRVYTGGRALEADLIDQIGEEHDAIVWLGDTHNIQPDLGILDWSISPWDEIWSVEPDALVLRLLGREDISLRGLVSLWAPGA